MSLLGPYGTVPNWPIAGDVWHHYKNNDYKVIGFARSEAGNLQVLYVRLTAIGYVQPEIYSRNIGDWMSTVQDQNGMHVARFVLKARNSVGQMETHSLSKDLLGTITPV